MCIGQHTVLKPQKTLNMKLKKIQFKLHVIKMCDSSVQKKVACICRLKPMLVFPPLV